MKENKLIGELKGIGLTGSEAKVYFHLLRKKYFTATEISKLTQVSQSKIYGILAKLVQKGLCIEILGSVKKYSSANPKTAFNALQQKLKQEYDNTNILISNLSKTLFPFYLSEKEKTNPLDYIQVLREKNRIAEKVESVERMAKEEVLSFDKPPYAMPKINEEEFRGLERGVKYKAVYEMKQARKTYTINQIETYKKAGEEIRIADELPMKMIIFDGIIVVLALRDMITSKTSLTAMVIEHPDITNAFKITFYSVWQKAMTLEEFKIKEKIL